MDVSGTYYSVSMKKINLLSGLIMELHLSNALHYFG